MSIFQTGCSFPPVGSIRLHIGNFVQRDLLQVLEPDAAAGHGRAVATGLNPDATVRQGARRQSALVRTVRNIQRYHSKLLYDMQH